MVKVLLDHNMPPQIARALDAIVKPDGHEVKAFRDHFPVNISDREYFGQLNLGWIVISKDLANSRKKTERAAILSNNIVAFYLSPALQKKRVHQQAAAILWHWDKILGQRQIVKNGLFQLPENKSQFRSL
ncbi:MAG: hypothetical protein GDA52_06770 [Rhodobacteraceae bacterium]|nr:hypothetical protein [Paracoccaceae bacterium]